MPEASDSESTLKWPNTSRVNTNPDAICSGCSAPSASRMTVRMGAYGEHQCRTVAFAGKTLQVNSRDFAVELAPGAGERIAIAMERYANQPALAPPW